jgi:hypothetical protein
MCKTQIRVGLVVVLVVSTVGCGPSPKGNEADGGTAIVWDAGLMISCPSGFTLGGPVQVTYKAQDVSSVSCWQATVGTTPLLSVSGLPDFDLGPLQLSLQFNAKDASGADCTWSNGQSVPLTSSCIAVEGSNLAQWFTLSNTPSAGINPAGSLTINQWAAASGQMVSVTFSEDAQLVVGQQTAVAVPIAGSFQVTAM